MSTYKLTINLDATLAVQNLNGSFNYFKPSIGAEFTVDETDDMTVLNKKFEDLYAEVIAPNFQSVVNEFLINSNPAEVESENKDDNKSPCSCGDDCDCKSSENSSEGDGLDTSLAVDVLSDIKEGDLPKEEWE